MRQSLFALAGVLSLFAPLALAGCQSQTDAAGTETSSDEVSASWLAGKVAPGSALEKQVLALANDRSMSTDEYRNLCGITRQVSNNLVNYRDGDEPADTVDDEIYDDLGEIDRIPYTGTEFWLAFIQCAKDKYGTTPTGGGVCATGTSKVQQSPLYVQFVVDDSGSMSVDNKWDATQAALAGLFTAQGGKNDATIAMGLNYFNEKSEVGLGQVDAAQGTALASSVNATDATAGTELLKALTAGYDRVEKYAPTGALANGSRAVVVLTDGVPNGGTKEETDTLAFVTAHAANAQLFTIGVGTFSASSGDISPEFLGQLAVAGGTRASATCNPTETLDVTKACYQHVTPNAKPASQLADELLQTFTKVRTAISACDIGLQAAGTGTLDPAAVTVTLSTGKTDTAVAADPVDGWSLDDATKPTKVLLRGAACATLRGDAKLTAKVSIACQ